jgi:hypothetical protein
VRKENVYWVDVAKPLPPTRLAKVPEITPTLRFFNGTRAVEAVPKTIEQIDREGRVPPGHQPGRAVRRRNGDSGPQHLAMCWAPKPPMRSTAGAGSIRRSRWSTAWPEGAPALSAPSDGEDVSRFLGGRRCQPRRHGRPAPFARPTGFASAALIGVQPDGGDNWLIGVVRRYAAPEPTRGSVGIETLSKDAARRAGRGGRPA